MVARVLIIGSYGNFGNYIARSLAEDAHIWLLIGGRSVEKAQAFAASLNAAQPAEGHAINIDGDLGEALTRIAPDIVIHTTGPFQTQDHRVTEACIAHGSHYLDLADARNFVTTIDRLDAEAKAKDVLVVSGASSVPCLTAAVIDVRNPVKLAELADRRIKATPKQLYDALHGRLTDHHRFMLKLYLEQYDALEKGIVEIDQAVDAAVAQMDQEVEAGQATFRALIGLLCTIPGVSTLSATTILAEIGADMSRFPTAGHLLAWAGLCPGQNESAGKRKSSRLRKGAPWLKTTLVQCAWSAVKKKDSYYKAQFNRLRARGGAKKAICAVAASMLTAIYHMLKDGTQHHDLGADHFDRRSTDTKPSASSPNSPSSASRSNCNPSNRRHEGVMKK